MAATMKTNNSTVDVKGFVQRVNEKVIEIDVNQFVPFGEADFDTLRIVLVAQRDSGRPRRKTASFSRYDFG